MDTHEHTRCIDLASDCLLLLVIDAAERNKQCIWRLTV